MTDEKMTPETIEKARQAQNEYMRKYRKKNREKMREINLRYWAKRAERESEGEPDAEDKTDS